MRRTERKGGRGRHSGGPPASYGTNASEVSATKRGLYARGFAWMLAHSAASDRRTYGVRKHALFQALSPGATVLEIGAGAGPNAAYFPAGLHWLAVEPNVHFHPYLRAQAEAHGLRLDLRPGTAERLPVEDASVDAVISTLVLCSVSVQAEALAEIRRVLKPGGSFYFIEHVAAPEGTVLRRLQQALRVPWGWVADGCRPGEGDEVVEIDGRPPARPLPVA